MKSVGVFFLYNLPPPRVSLGVLKMWAISQQLIFDHYLYPVLLVICAFRKSITQ